MNRLRSTLLGLLLAGLSVCAVAQGSNGQILYAADFGKWSLPQGTSPTNGMIQWQATQCTVPSLGFVFVAPKVGRPLFIRDSNPALSETVIPSSVIINNSSCTVAATMAHTHYTYQVYSGTGGLQEAIDYELSASAGALVALTTDWTVNGGTTGMLSSATGNTGVSLIDERASCFKAYNWGGSSYTETANFCTGGGGGGPTIQTDSVNNHSQVLLNFTDTSFNGLSFNFSNPSGGIETFGVTGTLNNAGLTNPSLTINGTLCTLGSTCNPSSTGTIPVWPNIYYSATAPSSPFTYASVFIGGTGYTVTIPSGCAGTFGNSTTNATSPTALVFEDITTSTNLCTLTFTSAGAAATVTGSGGTLSSGDLIALTVATADTSLAGVTAELAGTTPGAGGGGGSISLTTTGTSGLSALSGSTLNIPHYAGSGANADILSLSGLTTPLSVAQGGSGSTGPSLIAGVNITITGSWPNQTVAASSTASTAFSALTGSTNTTAAMLVGTGASLGASGSGTITATAMPYSGLTGSAPTWNQNTTGNAATATALVASPSQCSSGDSPTGVAANGNALGCAPLGGSPLWSSLLNPTGNLALTMAANTTTFTFNSATGSSDLIKKTDGASNTGTGILDHDTTASGSSLTPWQADANGVGWQVTNTGTLAAVGSSSVHGLILPTGSAIAAASGKITLWSDSGKNRLGATYNGGSNVYLASASGTAPSGDCAQFGTNGIDLADSGAPCSGGSSGNFVNIGSAVTFAIGSGGAGSFAGGVYTVATAGPSITISAIPGTYLNLKLFMVAQSSGSSLDGINMQLNGDTGSNYDWALLYGGNSSAAHTNQNGQSSAQVGFLEDTAVANYPSQLEMTLVGYAGTTFNKTFIATSLRNNNSNPDFDVANYTGGWRSTAAITSIKLTPASGPNFKAGTTISIYGLN